MSDRTTRSTRSSSRAPSRGAFQTSVLGQSSSTALVPNSNLAAQSKPIASLASPATTSTAVFTNARAFPPPTASRKRPLQTVTVSNQGASGSGSQNHSQGLERPKKKPQLEVIDLSSDSGGDDPVQIVGFHQPAKPGPVIQKQGGSQKRSGSLQDEVLMLRSKVMEQERQLADLRNVRQVVTASTAAESKLAAIEEHLNCNVCFETVERPFAVNPCGHEFCAKCLKEWFKDKKSKNEAMECPMCRTLVEGRPVRAFLLRAVVDVINGNGAVTTNSSADDKEFWRELFPNTVAPTPALALAQPLPGLYIPPGWRLPLKIPPHRLPAQLAHLSTELFRRGASAAMIVQLGLEFSPNDGIACWSGPLHVHFGWFIPEWMLGWGEWRNRLQIEMANNPQMWIHRLGSNCFYRVEREW